jgi:hypothetical protein
VVAELLRMVAKGGGVATPNGGEREAVAVAVARTTHIGRGRRGGAHVYGEGGEGAARTTP